MVGLGSTMSSSPICQEWGRRMQQRRRRVSRTSYTELKLVFLVGICGGVPNIDGVDAFLGDVVISRSIVQYDYGRRYPDRFEVKETTEDSLGRANKDIRGLLASIETDREKARLEDKAGRYL
ncbi:hypothetical protein V2G26_009929 [Clonostachys chloroleuca]